MKKANQIIVNYSIRSRPGLQNRFPDKIMPVHHSIPLISDLILNLIEAHTNVIKAISYYFLNRFIIVTVIIKFIFWFIAAKKNLLPSSSQRVHGEFYCGVRVQGC